MARSPGSSGVTTIRALRRRVTDDHYVERQLASWADSPPNQLREIREAAEATPLAKTLPAFHSWGRGRPPTRYGRNRSRTTYCTPSSSLVTPVTVPLPNTGKGFCSMGAGEATRPT